MSEPTPVQLQILKEIREALETSHSESLFDEDRMREQREVGGRMLFQDLKGWASSSPSNFRSIVCDETNNTEENLKEGVVNIHVFNHPPLERITVDIKRGRKDG
jgi:hypothetical protein